MDSDSAVDRLVRAAEGGDTALVTRLLGDGVPVDARSEGGLGPCALDIAVSKGHGDVVRVLITAGTDPDQPIHEYREFTPLTLAASHGMTDIVTLLLDAGVHPDASSRDGNALMFTVTSSDSHREMVDLLLDRGADLHLPVKGRTPLEWAAAAGKPEMVQSLLGRGAVPTAWAARLARTWGDNTFPHTWPDYERVLDLLGAGPLHMPGS